MWPRGADGRWSLSTGNQDRKGLGYHSRSPEGASTVCTEKSCQGAWRPSSKKWRPGEEQPSLWSCPLLKRRLFQATNFHCYQKQALFYNSVGHSHAKQYLDTSKLCLTSLFCDQNPPQLPWLTVHLFFRFPFEPLSLWAEENLSPLHISYTRGKSLRLHFPPETLFSGWQNITDWW